jgi:glutathione S-transferase
MKPTAPQYFSSDLPVKPMTIALYYSPGSCSLAVHVVLNEIGEPFELRKFATADRANYSTEYLDINPKGRIPALLIDGFVLTENPAILAYLGRRFPSAGLYPTDVGQAEAHCLELLAWSSNTVHVAYAQLLRPERFVPTNDSYPPVKESGRVNFDRCLIDIEDRLQAHSYAVGTQFTVVDPFWLVFYRWGVRSNYDMRSRFPAFTRYAERLCQRPSVQQALTVEAISIWN